MKHIYILIFLFFCFFNLINAQNNKITDNERIKLINNELSEAYSKIVTIECDYIQEKRNSMLEETLLTKGHVVYWNPKRLYWSANKPVTQLFIMNGDSIKIVNKTSTAAMPIAQHPVFKEISKIAFNSELQNSFIDNANFNVEYFKNGNNLIVKMKPKRSRLKNVMSILNIQLDSKNKTVQQIEITDGNGDVTTITLSNQKINGKVDPTLFTYK